MIRLFVGGAEAWYPRVVLLAQSRWLLSLSAAVIVLGCGGEYDVVIRDPAGIEAVRHQVAVIAACSAQQLDAQPNGPVRVLDVGNMSGEALGDLEPGSYGLFARAIDRDCQVVAAGCLDIQVEAGGSGPLVVLMVPVDAQACGAAQSCALGSCVAGGVDASQDAQDAGPDDSGPNDGAPGDAPSETGFVDSAIVDSAFVDTGVMDSAVPDSAPDAGPTLSFCERHGVGTLACLDFESDPLTEGWLALDGLGTMEIDGTFGVSGRSLHTNAGNDNDVGYEHRNTGVVGENAEQWLRIKVFLGLADARRAYYYNVAFLTGSRTEPFPFTGLSVVNEERPHAGHVRDGVNTTVPGDRFFPGDRWFCLEMHMTTSLDGVIELYLDGTLAGMASMDGRGVWDNVGVGGSADARQPEIDVWVDDLVWSTTRVPCNLE